ncbi:ATP-binding protein [Nocardiopsis ansamitocini]|uniref:Uncharacterized protein n=1 Tax=Nocardiopsis ansamitocini TaxID=1670832 RepID=A0A9W6P246_9ACTN|nr:hypothetical protein [Nocardiopsis ansamitocini]GLU45711.1 hypothetical protein Nans01_00620 [Nocardiopsis ansamitocini]
MERIITVEASPSAPRMVRSAIRDALAAHPSLDTAVLVSSELVASAVRVSHGEITIHVIGPDHVRIEVTDQRGTNPRTHDSLTEPGAPDPLGLVSLLASIGSHRQVNGDTTTWADIGLPPIPARSSQPHS